MPGPLGPLAAGCTCTLWGRGSRSGGGRLNPLPFPNIGRAGRRSGARHGGLEPPVGPGAAPSACCSPAPRRPGVYWRMLAPGQALSLRAGGRDQSVALGALQAVGTRGAGVGSKCCGAGVFGFSPSG